MAVALSPIGGAGAQFFDNNGNPLVGGKIYTYEAGTTTPAATYTTLAGTIAHTNPIILDSAGRVPGGEIWLTLPDFYKFVLKTSADVTIGTYDNIQGYSSGSIAYAATETQTATAGQTLFVLTEMFYNPGTNTLAVFIDGVNQVVNNSYVESTSTSVTFMSGLHVGAVVKFVNITVASTDATTVTYEPGFTGSVATTVAAKLQQTVSVEDFGAVGDGVTDDTAAIQAAIDYCLGGSGGTAYQNAKKLEFSNGIYAISKPLLIGGDSLFIEGNDCTIVKTTNDLPATTLPNISVDVPGGAVDPNQNAVFITSTRLRFSTIQNFNIEGVSGSSSPISVWGVGNENIFKNLYFRNISVGMQIPSMWMTQISHCVVRSPTSHGFWWTNARVSGTGQSGTSLHFDNCAVFGAAGKGFYIQDADYIALTACACDGSTEEAYWFSGVTGLNAHIGFEDMDAASVTPAIRCASGTTGVITLDTFDATARAYPAIKTTNSKITVFGRLRIGYTQYFDCTLQSIVDAQGLQILPTSGSELDNAKFVTDSDSHIYYTLADGTVGSTQYIYHFNNNVRWDETLVNSRVLNHTTTSTPQTSGTITLESGSDILAYTQQGKLVHIQGQATVASVGSPVGSYVDFSLPIASASTLAENGDRSGGACMYRDNGTLTVQIKPYWLLAASSTFRVYIDASTLTAGDLFNFSFSYLVD